MTPLILTPEQASALDAPHLVHAADVDGVYIGLVERDTAPQRVPGPPPTPEYRWTGSAWERPQTPDEVLADALNAVDQAAGEARRRYITDVSGQTAVYARKADQAREWIAAGFAGDAPPYLAAEAPARGMTPEQLAVEVDAIARQWDDVLSPAIEATRMGRKSAIRAAAAAGDLGAVQSITAAALAELAAI